MSEPEVVPYARPHDGRVSLYRNNPPAHFSVGDHVRIRSLGLTGMVTELLREDESVRVAYDSGHAVAVSSGDHSIANIDHVPRADTDRSAADLPTVGGFVQLPQSWDSSAGKIQNLVEHACGGVAVIRSAAHEERARHMHETDWHYLYVVSGSLLYWECAPGEQLAPGLHASDALHVRAGQMIFTPPKRPHVLRFTEDTVMVSISKLNRTHASHESDVVRL